MASATGWQSCRWRSRQAGGAFSMAQLGGGQPDNSKKREASNGQGQRVAAGMGTWHPGSSDGGRDRPTAAEIRE